MNRSSILFVVFTFILFVTTTVFAQSGGDYEITRSTIDTGGGQLGGGGYMLISSIGQPDTMVVSGGQYYLNGGFLVPVKDDTSVEPSVSFVSAVGSALEDSAGTQIILIALTVPNGETLDAPVTATIMLGGLAVLGIDYTFPTTSVTFPAGSTSSSMSLPLTILPDSDPESDETIIMMLSATGAALGSIQTFTFTILNDDETPDPTDDVTPEPTDDETPDPTGEVTPEPTDDVTPDPTGEVTPEPTDDVTPDPTGEVTPEPTDDVTPDPTGEVTPEPTDDASPTDTVTSTATETATATDTSTATETSTDTSTATSTATDTATDTVTSTATDTDTSTATATATETETPPTKIPTLPPTPEVIAPGDSDKDGNAPAVEAVIVIAPVPIIAAEPEASMRVTMSVQDGIMLPLFEWTMTAANPGTAYNLVIANAAAQVVMDEWVANQQPACSTQACRYYPQAELFSDGLVNGTYQWWLRSWQAGVYSEWTAPVTFVVNFAAPALPAMNIAPNQGRPTVSWAADPNAHWFNLFIKAQSGQTHLDQWFSASQLACSSGTCSVTPDLDLLPGVYDVYLRAWGPGGYSSNGSSEWAGPASFTLSAAIPAVPDSLAVTADSVLQWQGVSYATWYHVWVGPAGSNTPVLNEWILAADLGCQQPGLCQLPVATLLPAGSYHWYVRSYGPGGESIGGTLEGWAQGPQFAR